MKINQYRKLCLRLQKAALEDRAAQQPRDKVRFHLLRQFNRLKKSPYLDVHHRTGSVYIHIPKTGGNTITQTLFGRTSKHAGSHRAAWEYYGYDRTQYQNYYIFSMVRHPLSRMRSAFYYLKQGGMNATDKRFGDTVLAPYETFLHFIHAVDEDATLRHRVMNWLHFLPQSYFLCTSSGQCIVPHLLRMERFDADMHALCEKLGMHYTPRVINRTPRKIIPWENLSGAAAGICYQLYAADYALLGYDRLPKAPHSQQPDLSLEKQQSFA